LANSSAAFSKRGINYALDAFLDLGLAAALPFVLLSLIWRPSRDAVFEEIKARFSGTGSGREARIDASNRVVTLN
jgi:hypothetical protein